MRVEVINEALLKKSNTKLIKWIFKNFSLKNSKPEAIDLLESLKRLDDRILIYGIARMEQIETGFDQSKYMPPTIAILAAWFGQYIQVAPKIISFLLFSILIMYILAYIKRTRKSREAAVYFKSLLIQIKESKKASN